MNDEIVTNAEVQAQVAALMPVISGDSITIRPVEMALMMGYQIEWTYTPAEELRVITRLSAFDMNNLLCALVEWKRALDRARQGEPPSHPTLFVQDGEMQIPAREESSYGE